MDDKFCNIRDLTEQERVELCKTIDGFVKEFSESIDKVHALAEDIESSEDEEFKTINREFIAIGIFVTYCFCDMSLMTKQFLQSSNPYERAFVRGKLKVLLNESFKKLYGFTEHAQRNSYFARLKKLAALFPLFDSDIEDFEAKLRKLSTNDSWWKDVRNAEVHLDIEKLYQYRHEEVNENEVVLGTLPLIDIINRINVFLTVLHKVFITYLNIRE